MPFYWMDLPNGELAWVHMNFGRKAGPAPCIARDDEHGGRKCGRMSVALCDAPAGETLGGKTLTCDAPLCAKHRTKVGPNRDACPRHVQQLSLPEVG
jgi:hypothetical protein